MKLTILRENLKEGLTAIGRIASKNLTLPILNSVLLETEKNFLCLKATDLEIGIKWWILSRVEKEGRIACPLRIIQSLVDSLFAEKLLLRTEEKRLLIEAEGLQAQINGADADEFPIIPAPDAKTIFTTKCSQVVAGLAQVVEMAATSLVKPEIAGVCLHFSKDRLKMIATDSYRLAEKTILLESEVSQEASFILPQRACRELINIFGEKEASLRFYLSSTGNQVLLETMIDEASHPKIHFLSRLVEGEYPNYQEIIPKEFIFRAVLSKPDFLQQLKTISLFSNKINEVKINIKPKEQKIEFSGQNPEVGQGNSQLSAKIEGEAGQVSFNWRFLVEGLNQIKDKNFVFALSKDDGPAILKPSQDSDYFYLLMPLKV